MTIWECFEYLIGIQFLITMRSEIFQMEFQLTKGMTQFPHKLNCRTWGIEGKLHFELYSQQNREIKN